MGGSLVVTARKVSVLRAVKAELLEMGPVALASSSAATALTLAARLDKGADPGSAMAAMAKELRASMDALRLGAEGVGDPVDELLRRRELRLRPAAGEG